MTTNNTPDAKDLMSQRVEEITVRLGQIAESIGAKIGKSHATDEARMQCAADLGQTLSVLDSLARFLVRPEGQ